MALIQVEHLTFSYDGGLAPVFEDVSFQIDTDWKLGLIGRNGRGKTTFLKLLMGAYPYQGRISTSEQFLYFPYEVKDKKRLTIDILPEISEAYEEWKIRKELSGLDVEIDDILYRPFETLSNGEQTKVLLAAMFMEEDRFFLIDEPTNHLDQRVREIVGRYLKAKKSFILVSHDRVFLDSCIDHVLSINKANIEVQQGGFSTWWQNKQYQDQHERAENERLEKDMKRLASVARRTAGWADDVERSKYRSEGPVDRGYIGHKSAKMMKRATATQKRRERAVEEKQALLQNIDETETLKIHPLQHHQTNYVIAEQLSLFYGEKKVFSDIDFVIQRGARIALMGKNGAGKSSLLQLILGKEISHTGTLQLASGLRLSYVPQDTSFLKGELTTYAKERGLEESLFLAILRKMGFAREDFLTDMARYSAGQKKKVLIAASLCEEAHLYIWDEPLNYIDVISRMQIEDLLLEYKPTMLFVEHDAAFVKKVASGEIWLSEAPIDQ
ncbi:MAG: ribosomal protection-like ABC-F family protein [Christensenellaceae bacterium]|jgi:lincosamide and streptogramin A transport system ATP-binding/permease protein